MENDPVFNRPYTDVDEWRDTPVRHRYVHGGFTGTDARFAIYLPPPERYQGRFFQPLPPVPVPEEVAVAMWGGAENFLGFCFDSGAGAVSSNLGGFSAAGTPGSTVDPTISTFRVSGATARYARVLAAQMYGPHQTYVYAFGGSGGGYKSIACGQNSTAFDGVVPFMHPCPAAIPQGFAARIRGERMLKDKFAQISDALEPGGHGDIYAGLNEGERDVLREVTRFGFPVRTWVFHETMGIGSVPILFQTVYGRDPGYFDEFWRTPGYLGADRPELFAQARIQHSTRVKRVVMSNDAAAAGARVPGRLSIGEAADPATAWRNLANDYGGQALPVALELESPPSQQDLLGVIIHITGGASAGKTLWLGEMQGAKAMFQFGPATGSLRDITDAIRAGDEVRLDNSNYLAFESYYRHAMLGRDAYIFDQFRRADGSPMYPQRPTFNDEWVVSGVGTPITGNLNCKTIVLQYLLDWDAHAWFADWYRTRVREHMGARFAENYRLYYADHCTHGQAPDPTRTVSYAGILQQALRDLSAWVERGVAPLDETSYRVEDAQVYLPASAAERKGVQPVLSVQANGSVRADVRAGRPVTFTAVIEAPPGAGKIVAAEWDFDSTTAVVAGDENRFPVKESFSPAPRIELTQQHTFARPGTYFPALRAHSHREGDANTPFARVPNLGRVRVVVT